MKHASASYAALKYLLFFVFVAAFLLFWGRRPDILLNAQFWAEDGMVWYSEAWNQGALNALFHPHTGYFQTFSRVTLGLATLLPMEWAPTFSNLVALLVRSACISFLVTSRMNWAPLPARLLIGLYIALMPMWEVHANITNTHWYLGIYMVMIFVANPARSTAWRTHDLIAISLIGLSGPFSILAAPVVAIRAWVYFKKEDKFSWLLYAAWAITVVIQLTSIIMFGQQDRFASKTGLGATVPLFFQIIGSHLVAGSLVPGSLIPNFASHQIWMTALAISAATVTLYSFVKSNWQLRSLIIFSVAILFASLISPVQTETGPQWPTFLSGAGERYFIVPRIALIAAFGFALGQIRPQYVRNGAVFVATVCCLFVLGFSFFIDPLQDFEWSRSVATYRQAASGSIVSMPVPPGNGWEAGLIVK